MSAQVTEAHRELVAAIIRDLSIDDGAQLIADSEAKAMEQANAQVESLLSAAKNAIPASEHPAEPTVENWAWQIRNLGEDRRLVYADRDKLRAEVQESKERERVAIASCDEERQRALREGGRVVELRAEVERLTARESNQSERIRYLEGATNHATGTPLSQAIARAESAEREAFDWKKIARYETARAERAEAELATERARLADLVADLNDACITLESAENDCDDYAMQNTAFKLNAVRAVLLQYIPNAAMKEGGK